MLDHPYCPGDPLTDVLSLVGVESAPVVRFEIGGAWATLFPGHLPVEFGVVVEGNCWLVAAGDGGAPRKLTTGDYYVLTRGRSYRLNTDLEAGATDVQEVLARHRGADGVVRYGDGGEKTVLVGGGFTFRANGGLLLDLLPPVFHLRTASGPAPLLRSALHHLARETASPRLGTKLVARGLAQIVFVQVLRDYAASRECPPVGWLGAFADPRIGTALRLMHGGGTRRWTLPELATAVGMSRSGFALRFKTLVGVAPLDYLLRWNMQMAGCALRDTNQTVSSVAFRFGYSSESAFSHAFTRVMGHSPKQHRTQEDSSAAGDKGGKLVPKKMPAGALTS